MNKIYADAEEKFVKAVVLYGYSDNYLYTDEAHNTKISKDDLMNLCLKGLVIKYNDTYYNPVFFKEESGYLGVTIATAIAASSSAATVLYSSEYNAD